MNRLDWGGVVLIKERHMVLGPGYVVLVVVERYKNTHRDDRVWDCLITCSEPSVKNHHISSLFRERLGLPPNHHPLLLVL